MKDSGIRSLTLKEKKVLEFLETYMKRKGLAPSFQEIQTYFEFKSINSVQNYLKQLETKGYIHLPGGNQKRALSLLKPASAFQSQAKNLKELKSPSSSYTPSFIPLLGHVAAGQPIERIEHNETLEVPSSMVANLHSVFALRVEGDSMIDDGIFNGDFLIVQQQANARNGEIIVATIENEATVKRFYSHSTQDLKRLERDVFRSVELRPSNQKMDSFWFTPRDVQIQGKVIGLIRKY